MAIDIELIRKNFFSIAERADELTKTFYTTLFMRYPGVAPLFDGVDMEQQRKMLANAIVFVIENLETMDVARSTLEEMGRRHIAYGAEAEHYPAFGECLLHAIATITGDAWTDELQANWTEALGVISTIMIEGAEKAVAATSAT